MGDRNGRLSLEEIDIDHQQRQRRARTLGAVHLFFDRHVKMAPVGDARQAIRETLRTQFQRLLTQQPRARDGGADIGDLDQTQPRGARYLKRRDGNRLLISSPLAREAALEYS